jgi:hypothetical protein
MRKPFCKLGTQKITRMYVLQKRLKVCGVGFFKYREHTGVRGDSLSWTGCKMYEMRSLPRKRVSERSLAAGVTILSGLRITQTEKNAIRVAVIAFEN